jgi:hypothetical protein
LTVVSSLIDGTVIFLEAMVILFIVNESVLPPDHCVFAVSFNLNVMFVVPAFVPVIDFESELTLKFDDDEVVVMYVELAFETPNDCSEPVYVFEVIEILGLVSDILLTVIVAFVLVPVPPVLSLHLYIAVSVNVYFTLYVPALVTVRFEPLTVMPEGRLTLTAEVFKLLIEIVCAEPVYVNDVLLAEGTDTPVCTFAATASRSR